MAEDTLVASPPPPSSGGRHRRSTGDKIRFVVRGIGQTLITLGFVVLLFVVYEVWITNIFADQKQAAARHSLERVFDDPKAEDPTLKLPGQKTSTIPIGRGIANLYLPRLGADYVKTIVQGSNNAAEEQDALEDGPTHYPGTALPGQIGNFAISGHRVGKGEPFLNMDKLRAGDAVIIETKQTWFVYRVKGTENGLENKDADGVPGREIVDPSAGRVLLPVPDHPGAKATERLMTMTTCHPKFTAAQRMVVHAKLAAKYSVQFNNGKRVDTMPAPVSALFKQVKI